jgi:hypothetical protein
MTSKDVQLEKQYCIEDLIALYELEIKGMEKLLELINSKEWNNVDFCLNLKKEKEIEEALSSFNFKDCVPEKYIIAIKKLVKMAFEEGLKNKKIELEKIKNK